MIDYSSILKFLTLALISLVLIIVHRTVELDWVIKFLTLFVIAGILGIILWDLMTTPKRTAVGRKMFTQLRNIQSPFAATTPLTTVEPGEDGHSRNRSPTRSSILYCGDDPALMGDNVVWSIPDFTPSIRK